ncbi:MAG: GntR family transcriptional regulator [Blastocatellales bacterium]
MKANLNSRVAALVGGSPLNHAGKPALADSLKSQVLEILKEKIFAGTVKPGGALREMHIAREFNVSQATVREALLQLEQLGLAVRMANRGTIVTRLTPQDVRNRLEIRSELDPLACIKASALMTEDDFSYLERLAKEISKDYKTPNYNFYETSQIDFQFHRYIWQKSGSAILCTTLEQVTLPLFAFIGLLRQVGVEERRTGAPHKPIIEALRGRKAREIKQVVRRHFENSYNHFIESNSDDLQAVIERNSR